MTLKYVLSFETWIAFSQIYFLALIYFLLATLQLVFSHCSYAWWSVHRHTLPCDVSPTSDVAVISLLSSAAGKLPDMTTINRQYFCSANSVRFLYVTDCFKSNMLPLNE